jgi:hypothetical protein
MSPVEVLHHDYLENICTSFKENQTHSRIEDLIEKYITDRKVSYELSNLVSDLTANVSEESFRAGFIAGAYPLQGVK